MYECFRLVPKWQIFLNIVSDLSHTIFKLKYLEITLKCIAVPAIQLIEPMNMLNCKLDYLPRCNNSFVYTENVILMKAT